MNPGERFDLCAAFSLQSTPIGADEKREHGFKISVFGQSPQFRVKKVILTTGMCYICTLSLPLWRCDSPKNIERNKRKKLILLLTEFTLTSLPGCFWRSVSSSGSADMISRNVTLGYHQPQCRSHTSREQRWATRVERNRAHGVRASVHQQMAVEIRLPGYPSGCHNQHSFLQLA